MDKGKKMERGSDGWESGKDRDTEERGRKEGRKARRAREREGGREGWIEEGMRGETQDAEMQGRKGRGRKKWNGSKRKKIRGRRRTVRGRRPTLEPHSAHHQARHRRHIKCSSGMLRWSPRLVVMSRVIVSWALVCHASLVAHNAPISVYTLRSPSRPPDTRRRIGAFVARTSSDEGSYSTLWSNNTRYKLNGEFRRRIVMLQTAMSHLCRGGGRGGGRGG